MAKSSSCVAGVRAKGRLVGVLASAAAAAALVCTTGFVGVDAHEFTSCKKVADQLGVDKVAFLPDPPMGELSCSRLRVGVPAVLRNALD